MKWDPKKLEMQLLLYRDMTFRSRPADLIVWPETAVPILRNTPKATSDDGWLRRAARIGADHRCRCSPTPTASCATTTA